MLTVPRRLTRALTTFALAAIAFPCIYLALAVAGALVPRNPGWQEPENGTEIFVRTNGVHVDLVLPARAAEVDWYALLPPRDVENPSAAAGWVAIGWGQREFYLETPTWADLEWSTALRALTGGEALMHVEHGPRPIPSDTHRLLRIDRDAYTRLADAIARGFKLTEDAQPLPLIGRGYGTHDVFYEAHGVYHAFRTSNQWTGDMLAEAGVEIGIWTPFAQSVIWRF